MGLMVFEAKLLNFFEYLKNFEFFLVIFEAKLTEGQVLKRIVDSIKDLVTDVNIDATP